VSDIYHVYCDTKPGVRDTLFCERLGAYFAHLRERGLIAGWRITRAKLGFGLRAMGDWHIMIELRDLAQLEAAFQHVAGRDEPVEGLHHGVNSLVANPVFALTRDFPDAVRKHGEERF
jgi:hypothetical protein